MANQRRVFKVAERIQGVIASELLRLADPRFTLVTITSVAVSSDMRIAKVYWVVSGDEERRSQVEEAFEGAQGILRKAISREIQIRFIPHLKFFYDDTLDVQDEVNRLCSTIQGSEETRDDDS